jgi:glycosyltransferase involved in cell wall biosynthesis
VISVIIPAYNEEKNIAACLEGLVGQKTTKPFEVIVVNNNSTDRTEQIVKSYEKKLNLKIIGEKEKGRGPTRHTGFAKAEGEISFSTDADTIVPPNWIEALSAKLARNHAIAVTGTCKVTDCGVIKNATISFLQPLAMHIYRLLFGHYWLSGFSFAITKDAYIQSGTFDRKLNALEDIDLSFKVSKIGHIQFIGNTPVIFSGRRFRQNLLIGAFPYVSLFVQYMFLKRNTIVLQDIR